jgi:hypothetical protein
MRGGDFYAADAAAAEAARRVMGRLLQLVIRCGQQTHASMSGEALRARALGALGATGGGGGDDDELSYSASEQKVKGTMQLLLAGPRPSLRSTR